jgi:Raf kinase inhibitor-like YbhB/YbcL family protein
LMTSSAMGVTLPVSRPPKDRRPGGSIATDGPHPSVKSSHDIIELWSGLFRQMETICRGRITSRERVGIRSVAASYHIDAQKCALANCRRISVPIQIWHMARMRRLTGSSRPSESVPMPKSIPVRPSWRALQLSLAFSFFMTIVPEGVMMSAQARSFTVTSPGLADGALLSRRNAGSGGDCGGDNISPALAWSEAPDGTKSYAIVVYDPDGGKGLGSVHWVAYDISPSTSAFAEGAGAASSGSFVGGANTRGTASYFGPCPPVGDQPHHYVFSVYALDLEPETLAPGLTRELFFQAVRGHVLAASSVVLRYAR